MKYLHLSIRFQQPGIYRQGFNSLIASAALLLLSTAASAVPPAIYNLGILGRNFRLRRLRHQ